MFPTNRLRRLRTSPSLRALLSETALSTHDFIAPIFVISDTASTKPQPISSLPGHYQWPLSTLGSYIDRLQQLGVLGVLLFGVSDAKDDHATASQRYDGIIPKALKICKDNAPSMIRMTDVCLCSAFSHGHCGILNQDGTVDNDKTLELIARQALVHAASGADVVAPSGMMDGAVKSIRELLDVHGYIDVSIMAYSAKFASGFYGPFREAAQSAPQTGDRKTYQLNPANRREALQELQRDSEEGADILMIKPALAYMDLIREARDRFLHPLAAYNVSGEYAMLMSAASQGWIDGPQVALEMLCSMKRAGATFIITYFSEQVIPYLS